MAVTESLLAYFAVTKPAAGGGSVAGGLLVVNALARPLEFHCTAPVSVNRAQEILYGRTLESFLIADQICTALLQKVARPLRFLLVQPAAALAVRGGVEYPVLALEAGANEADWNSATEESNTSASTYQNCCERLELAGQCLRVQASGSSPQDIDEFRQWLETTPNLIDLLEPFERIHLALEEARKAA